MRIVGSEVVANLPIVFLISGMEFSFQKTILNVKTGTLGKVVFCIYGENDTDNCVISRFVGFYIKKMQIGTKKSYRYSRKNTYCKNVCEQLTIRL